MKHLSSEQISSLVAGLVAGTGDPELAHILECPTCALEVDRARNVLAMFRSSVREWTDTMEHTEFPIRERIVPRAHTSQHSRNSPLAWLLAAAALTIAVAIPVYQDSRERELKAQAERDNQLIDAVNAQLSRSGPLAMDPLMRLMSFPDSGPGTESTKSEGIKTNAGKSQ